jgi:hypothetical protein
MSTLKIRHQQVEVTQATHYPFEVSLYFKQGEDVPKFILDLTPEEFGVFASFIASVAEFQIETEKQRMKRTGR